MRERRFFHFFASRADAVIFFALIAAAIACVVCSDGIAPGERFAPIHEAGLPGVATVGENRGKIDINSADAALLMELDGIGEVLAARIVEYRELHGPFSCPEDLLNVNGIGAVRFAAIQDSICVLAPD